MTRAGTLRLVRAAAAELRRAARSMRSPGYPRPYYVSYLIRDEERFRLKAKYGARIEDLHERKRNAFVDVRVGSYRADQVRDGGLLDNDKEAESYGLVELPFGADPAGLRHALWRLTDARYREALDGLLQKKAHEVTYRNPHRHLAAFERREARVHLGCDPLPRIDREHWGGYVDGASRSLRRFPAILDSSVELQVDHTVRVFVSSEGSRQIQSQPIWSLECRLWAVSDEGEGIPWSHRYMVTDPAELPDLATFRREIARAVTQVRRLAAAPLLRSFSGPALLEPVPAGLLIHEAVGHRLEGNRLLAGGEGQTFKGALGRRVLPGFLSLHDDPRLRRFEGRSLAGHYRFDDEGIEAQDAALVCGGKLEGYLTSRAGIARAHRSNGHARSDYHQRPMSRMGVLVVEADPGLSDAALKRALLDEIKRQRVPFGVRILDATSGETSTDAYDFQAFLGEINLAARVWPDGREELIRGVNFVGTPLNVIRGIVAAGRRRVVDNSWCGAESGFLPVSTISPALVVSELELQSKPEEAFEPATYAMPWDKRVRSRGSSRRSRA